MLYKQKQGGFTLIGWLVIAVIGGFFVYLSMILFTPVVKSFTIDTLMTSLQAEPGITEKPKAEIRKLIFNRLLINDINDIQQSDFEIVKESDDLVTVYLDYEDKIEFAKNIFIVIVHNKAVDLKRN